MQPAKRKKKTQVFIVENGDRFVLAVFTRKDLAKRYARRHMSIAIVVTRTLFAEVPNGNGWRE